jgi:hypothetical protein
MEYKIDVHQIQAMRQKLGIPEVCVAAPSLALDLACTLLFISFSTSASVLWSLSELTLLLPTRSDEPICG